MHCETPLTAAATNKTSPKSGEIAFAIAGNEPGVHNDASETTVREC